MQDIAAGDSLENVLDRIVKFINDFSVKSYRDEETKVFANNNILVIELFKRDDGEEDHDAIKLFGLSFNIWKQLKNELAVECEIEVLGGGWRRKVEVLQKGSSINLYYRGGHHHVGSRGQIDNQCRQQVPPTPA